jgi:hypothetical protein
MEEDILPKMFRTNEPEFAIRNQGDNLSDAHDWSLPFRKFADSTDAALKESIPPLTCGGGVRV